MTDDLERTPPQDIPAEQCVLGGMLLSRDAIADVLDILRGPDYYRPAHQLTHEAVLRLYERDEPVDAVTVAAELVRSGDIARMGGHLYLHTLIASVPAAANAGYYARIVRERAILRRLVEVGTRIAQIGYAADGDAGELVSRAEAEMATVAEMTPAQETTTAADLIGPLLDDLEAGAETVQGIESAWADLNAVIPGFRPGEITVVGGRPGTGKSVVLLNVAAHAALRLRHHVLAVTLEMSRREYMERLLASESGVELGHIRDRSLTEDDWTRISRARDAIAEASTLHIHEGPDLTPAGIRAALRGMQRAGTPPALLTLDYLQLMEDTGRRESRQLEVSAISRNIKLIAKEFGIPVLVGSQLNRGPEMRGDKRPLTADLRESGAVENDADIVILLYRDEVYVEDSPQAGEIELHVAKNRQGKDGVTVTLAFQGHLARCTDVYRAPKPWTPHAIIGGVA